jgi:hypothetical protein
MSIRNGDKSRYHRQRKKRISLRERNHILFEGQGGARAAATGKAASTGKAAKPAKPKVAK